GFAERFGAAGLGGEGNSLDREGGGGGQGREEGPLGGVEDHGLPVGEPEHADRARLDLQRHEHGAGLRGGHADGIVVGGGRGGLEGGAVYAHDGSPAVLGHPGDQRSVVYGNRGGSVAGAHGGRHGLRAVPGTIDLAVRHAERAAN